MTAPTIGLVFLNAHGIEVTTAHTIAGPCSGRRPPWTTRKVVIGTDTPTRHRTCR